MNPNVKITNLSHSQVGPYKNFNFAVLRCRGLDNVFNIMRYDTAFFARLHDVSQIITLGGNNVLFE